MSSYEAKPVSAEELDALVRAAQAERDRQLKQAIVRGAKSVAKFFRTVSAAMSEAYEAERRRTAENAASSINQRWASGD
jgi:DNA-binding NtrC family response regulator